VRRGSALGSDEFPKELLARMDVPVGQSHYGPELRESDEEKARRLIADEIAKRKFPPLNFSEMNKGDKQRETWCCFPPEKTPEHDNPDTCIPNGNPSKPRLLKEASRLDKTLLIPQLLKAVA
jgi:hypothetical protein